MCVETPPQATPLSLLPSLLPFPFHLGSFSFAAHGLRLEVSAAGVGSVKSSVTHLVVTIYCIFYLFSVTDLLIYRMVQMFWHNYFGLHYLFMMLFFFFFFVIVFYTFGMINGVHVEISISKKSVTHEPKGSDFHGRIPRLLDWVIF